MQHIDISKIKGIIFDLDGTLADTMPLHLEAWNEVGNPMGLVLSHEEHLRYAGMPTEHIVGMLAKQLNISINAKDFTSKKEYIFAHHKLQQVKFIEPVADFLRQLYKSIPMAIGTGSTRETASKVVEFLDAEKYTNIIVSADDVSKHKPAPDTFLRCAELMGVKQENCLVFEDSELGMEAARKGGMQAINVMKTDEKDLKQILAGLKAIYYVD